MSRGQEFTRVKRLLGRLASALGAPSSPPPATGARSTTPPGAFDHPAALEINRARLAHLASLGLPLEGKRVLDVGCGLGHLAQFFVERRCRVVCLDGREENIRSLRSRYPNLEAHVANVDSEALSRWGEFDIVFCYGLLYHLENPLAALRNMAAPCQGLMLLETLICDHELPLLLLQDEPCSENQALQGLGCRPSPSFVIRALRQAGFSNIYAPRTPPEHCDFRFKPRNNLDASRAGHPLRRIFIGSRAPVRNSELVQEAPPETTP